MAPRLNRADVSSCAPPARRENQDGEPPNGQILLVAQTLICRNENVERLSLLEVLGHAANVEAEVERVVARLPADAGRLWSRLRDEKQA